jgi:hypothetical protein
MQICSRTYTITAPPMTNLEGDRFQAEIPRDASRRQANLPALGLQE